MVTNKERATARVSILNQFERARKEIRKNIKMTLFQVDQMSLHASSVPTNENATTKPHDTVPELHRQLQYQEEEKKAVLKKLIETDKEKVAT